MNLYEILNKIIKKNAEKTITNTQLVELDSKLFKSALQQSKSILSNFANLQLQYKEMFRDPQFAACYQIIKQNILSKNYNELKIDKNIISKIIEYVLESVYFGYSLLEVNDINNKIDIKNYDREYYNPRKKMLLKYPYAVDGQSIMEEGFKDWFIPILHDYEGLFAQIAHPIIFNNDLTKNWISYLKKYSHPQPILKTAITDDDNNRQMMEYLENIQNGSYAVIDSDSVLEFLQPNSTNSDLFEKLQNYLIKTIKQCVLGSDSLNTENSFVGSTTVAYTLLNEKLLGILNYIEYQINNNIFPALTILGYSEFNTILEFDKNFENRFEQKNDILELLKVGIQIDSKFLEDYFKIKISNEGAIRE